MKIQDTLHNWGGITCEVITDEDVKDIQLMIKYHDHGDEFLYVRTYSGEEYEYGYYFDRINCLADFDRNKNNGESDNWFIKRPILFKEPDTRSTLSNEICWAVDDERLGIKNRMGFGVLTDEISDDNAKTRFEFTLMRIKALLERYSNRRYDKNELKDDLLTFIEVHNLGDDCVSEVNKIKWDSKVNGFDGIAGKKESSNYLHGDGVIEVLYKGKEFDIKKLRYKRGHRDQFGCTTYIFNTKQFA